ncbi:hypothetical protein QM012_005135 [Aureobasidium pullulans]|uniref:F-box domain-containing protein n=1 Tax=Aureobasidium pullulans TaxID=5580 RepID=A0ABR0T5W8_AURPU
MSNFPNLPPELLSRIVNHVATPPPPDPKRRSSSACAGQHVPDGPTYAGLSYANIALATSPAPDIASLRSLRLVSKTFEQLSTPVLFSVVRILPTTASAQRYTKILEELKLNRHVRKVVFQTRLHPDRRGVYRFRADRLESEEYTEPHAFFLAAMLKAAKFPNLTHAELIFTTQCGGSDWDSDTGPETQEFRFEVLSTFYAGLVEAKKLFNLSIKSLQNITPQALTGRASTTEEMAFKANFDVVMKRVTQLGLGITIEDYDAEPAHTLTMPEVHDFFAFELSEYWLKPFATQLEYLKIYGNEEVYWGFYPACDLPHFPALRTLILGDYSFTSEKHVKWILSHTDTLEELILDDAIIGVGVTIRETHVDITSQTVVYEKDYSSNPPGCQPKWRGRGSTSQYWRYSTRWHHLFKRFAQGLPKLKHLAINHSHWDERAYEHADALCSAVRFERYAGLDETVWHDFDGYDIDDFDPSEWQEHAQEGVRIQMEKPDCEEEDWQALNELLGELRRRR